MMWGFADYAPHDVGRLVTEPAPACNEQLRVGLVVDVHRFATVFHHARRGRREVNRQPQRRRDGRVPRVVDALHARKEREALLQQVRVQVHSVVIKRDVHPAPSYVVRPLCSPQPVPAASDLHARRNLHAVRHPPPGPAPCVCPRNNNVRLTLGRRRPTRRTRSGYGCP